MQLQVDQVRLQLHGWGRNLCCVMSLSPYHCFHLAIPFNLPIVYDYLLNKSVIQHIMVRTKSWRYDLPLWANTIPFSIALNRQDQTWSDIITIKLTWYKMGCSTHFNIIQWWAQRSLSVLSFCYVYHLLWLISKFSSLLSLKVISIAEQHSSLSILHYLPIGYLPSAPIVILLQKRNHGKRAPFRSSGRKGWEWTIRWTLLRSRYASFIY